MDNCGTLDVFCDGTHCISLWRPTAWERIKILLTGNIWLWIHSGKTQPPVALDTVFPFLQQKAESASEVSFKRAINSDAP